MASTEFVLQDIPLSTWNLGNDFIIDYVEDTLDTDVKEVKLYPFLPGSALVVVNDEIRDFSEAARIVSNTPLESCTMKMMKTHREAKIVIMDFDVKKMSEEFVALYFECVFANGENIVDTFQSWPSQNLAVIKFQPSEMRAVEKILEEEKHMVLPSEKYFFSVGPFYHNFHDHIGQPVLTQQSKSKTKLLKNESSLNESKQDDEVYQQYHKPSEQRKSLPGSSDSCNSQRQSLTGRTNSMKEKDSNSAAAHFECEGYEEQGQKDDDEEEEVEDEKEGSSEDETERESEIEQEEEDEESEEDLEDKRGLTRDENRQGMENMRQVHYSKTKISTADKKQSAPWGRGRGMGRVHDVNRVGSCPKGDVSEAVDPKCHKNSGQDSVVRDSKVRCKRGMRGNGRRGRQGMRNRGCVPQSGKDEITNLFEKKTDAFSADHREFKNDNFKGRNMLNTDLCDLNVKSSTHSRGNSVPSFGRGSKMHAFAGNVELQNCNERHFPRTHSEEQVGHNYPVGRPQAECTMPHRHSTSELSGKSSYKRYSGHFKIPVLDEPTNHDSDVYTQQFRQEALKKLLEENAKLKEKSKLEENAKLKEKSKPFRTNIDMEEWQAQWLVQCFENSPSCQGSYIAQEKKFYIEGSEEDVKSCETDLLKEVMRMKNEQIEISPAVYSLITSERGKTYLEKLESSDLNGAKIFCCEKSVTVVAREDHILRAAVEIVKEKLNYVHKRTSKTALPNDKLMMVQSKQEHDLLVKISWNDKFSDIYVEGIKDDVLRAVEDVDHLLEEYGEEEKVFKISGPLAEYFSKYCEAKMMACSKDVEASDYVLLDKLVEFKLKGPKRNTQLALRKLEGLKAEITSKCWDITSEFREEEDLMLITKGFLSKEVKEKIDLFQMNKKCLVSATLPKLESFKMNSQKQKIPPKLSSPSKSKPQRRVKASIQKFTEGKVKFSVTSTCQIAVKSYGNIVQETSDIVVCILSSNVDLRKTRVGLAFNKACPILWKSLKAEQQAHPSDTVLTTKGPFPGLRCKAICHVILTPWDSASSPAYLDSAIKSVLAQATALGAKSISFPALGCGRVLQFPPSHVAQIVITTMKTVNHGNLPNKITFLAPDPELFKELKTEASKAFLVLTPQPQGAVGGLPVDQQNDDNDEEDESASSESEESDEQTEIVIHEKSNWNICITAERCSGFEKMWSHLKEEIILQLCLHTDYFNQDITKFWPRDSREKILKEAKRLWVWVKRSPNPKTKKSGYSMKGEKHAVNEMKEYIKQEFQEISRHMPKCRIISKGMPKRGTVDFMRHAANSDEPFPSYWALNKSSKWWTKLKDRFTSRHSEDKILRNVDSKTEAAITKLVKKTFDRSLVSVGADAHGLSHTGIKIVDIKRIENVNFFETYRIHRKQLFQKMCSAGKTCPDIGKLPSSKGRIKTTEILDDFMKEELYFEINEHYLFHGTKPDTVQILAQHGIDPKVSSVDAMFGRGIYTAEDFTKSDQYTDSIRRRTPPGTKLTIILARMLLGNVFLCNERHPSVASRDSSAKLQRPPCMHCQKDKCKCENQTLYDSVMGDGKWKFREFVVYDAGVCYPEYVITYQRT